MLITWSSMFKVKCDPCWRSNSYLMIRLFVFIFLTLISISRGAEQPEPNVGSLSPVTRTEISPNSVNVSESKIVSKDDPLSFHDEWFGVSSVSGTLSGKRRSKVFDRKDSGKMNKDRRNRMKNHRRKLNSRGKPNIILILTDDQDIELGSMNFMPKTSKIFSEEGAHFPNAYVTTPMCCPSRSSILTGLYSHNHNVHTNKENCSSTSWQVSHEKRTFATYLREAGYRTAFFGKYLNEYDGNHIPPGWLEWQGLVKNSHYYNYTLNVNGVRVHHGSNYALDYYPDLIINDSLTFLRRSRENFPNAPVLMVLSFPSPHGPEEAAPQYQHLFQNVTTHRWNYAPNPDKQWLLRFSPKMEQIHMDFTDILHTRRLQTLQSVDEALGRLHGQLKRLKELENTYIFYSSDHGFHLGQFGLLKGKSMPFEFDIRVPFFARGPLIPAGSIYKEIVLNIDIAPTFLDIAGVRVPEHVDGKSILPLIDRRRILRRRKKITWRDTFLIERGKLSGSTKAQRLRAERKNWIKAQCQKPDFRSPCQLNQEWECVSDGHNFHLRKCRNYQSKFSTKKDDQCICPPPYHKMGEKHGQSPEKGNLEELDYPQDESPHYLSTRRRRFSDTFNVDGIYHLSHLLDSTTPSGGHNLSNAAEILRYHGESGCFLYVNLSILCPDEVYSDGNTWAQRKNAVENSIKELEVDLYRLRGINQHLSRKKPSSLESGSSHSCECIVPQNDRGSKPKVKARKRNQKLRKKLKSHFENSTCHLQQMTCFAHDDNHWKTPPLWEKGPFCSCQNANNNTFWCLRTINATHNFLYCEFITGYITYYDMNQDPFQLRNLVYTLEWPVLKQMRRKLNKLRVCSGHRRCNNRVPIR
ncbi:putative extracellular sulfatase Sulf-1 homolog isoform X2 [Brevipalpus obovatus]|uniref:putative extracellular sulfatase Sulf-1 homolog isoform X2 n=1 Tax=Brevipalpus obovatus TaxID=246614 RepID=UPI003D9E0343